MARRRLLIVCLLAVVPVAVLGDGNRSPFTEFDDPHLKAGREIWLGTCQACHGTGLAGAPPATDYAAWAPRIAKGRDTLYQHALQGFFGPDGTMMPERGGNDSLSDEQVRSAVDYMVELAKSNKP